MATSKRRTDQASNQTEEVELDRPYYQEVKAEDNKTCSYGPLRVKGNGEARETSGEEKWRQRVATSGNSGPKQCTVKESLVAYARQRGDMP